MFLVDAENDGFGEAIGLLEKIRDIARDRFGASLECDGAFEIDGLILTVGYRAAVTIEVALARPPARRVSFSHDAVNSIGREKTVFDSLA